MAHRFALAASLAALLCFSSDAFAQRRGSGSGGVTVFDNPDFRGSSATFRGEVPDLRLNGLNDRVTSIDIRGGEAWEICQDINFGGRCRVISGSVDDLRDIGWNDRISSMRPAGYGGYGRNDNRSGSDPWWGNQRDNRSGGNYGQSRLVVYAQPNFRGDSRTVDGSLDLGSLGNRVRSVEVVGNGSWQLCDQDSNGRCVTISNSVSDVRSLGLRNGVTSVREVGSGNSNRNRGW